MSIWLSFFICTSMYTFMVNKRIREGLFLPSIITTYLAIFWLGRRMKLLQWRLGTGFTEIFFFSFFLVFFLYSLLCYILLLNLQWVILPLDGCMWEMREDVRRSIQSPFWIHRTTSFSSPVLLFFSLSFLHLFLLIVS